uniref:Uncharacterized protein n=1 Tax=Monopterus albus TaxID=43700 RepID=A0A3Q3Q1T4_MONAL
MEIYIFFIQKLLLTTIITSQRIQRTMCLVYFPLLNLPRLAPVFFFLLADPFTSDALKCTFRLVDRDPVTVKKESSRPCVLPCLLFTIFLQPLRILVLMLHLNCFSLHMNWIRPSSSGSLHFSSTEEQSTTSGIRNKVLASLYSQSSGAGCFLFFRISSMQPCCLIRSMALLGPMPLMVPQ